MMAQWIIPDPENERFWFNTHMEPQIFAHLCTLNVTGQNFPEYFNITPNKFEWISFEEKKEWIEIEKKN